ncbi:MAG TPA: hypothetical protein QGG70_00845 [Candidatus Pacearchaeota archaeon]|jgi:hypothetical protein|nr:hypothetical protein [Candidatus Pacearchaeota archaeon]
MVNNKDSFFRGMFLVAAIYDLILGIIFFFFYKQAYAFFNITIPTYPMYLQMAAAFVMAMGVGYYFIYTNLYRNIDLVKLGIVYKIVYSGLTSYFYFVDLANITFFWFAIIDAIFLILFVWFLVYAKKDGRYLQWK